MIGLGNPGAKYHGTRHNIGAEFVACLANFYGAELLPDQKLQCHLAQFSISQRKVLCAFPQTYMNESGRSVALILNRYEIDSIERIVVAHDELDIEPGHLKAKSGGGLHGHNGLRSLNQHLKTPEFTRFRLGIGRPAETSGMTVKDWVLSRPSRSDRERFDQAIDLAVDAFELLYEPILQPGPADNNQLLALQQANDFIKNRTHRR